MKKVVYLASISLLIFSAFAKAQSVPPPPVPIVETDLRDNTIRMRSVELERIKRDSEKPSVDGPGKVSNIKFGFIREDFEKIQLLQDSIITAYTKGKSIDFQKLSDSAFEMRKRSVRLDMNLFSENPRDVEEKKTPATQKRFNLRDLIVELDNAIGRFVASPIFQNTKLVETSVSETAKLDLATIIRLSETISQQASMLGKTVR
jgi:nucleoid DNA-binding protein